MLSDIVFETKTVKFAGGEFAVRGIGLHAIAGLINTGSRDDLEKAISVMRDAINADRESLDKALSKLVTLLPSLACRVIAFAAGEPDQHMKVGQLPLPVQFEAIQSIFSLTFGGAESLKKFLGALMSSLSAATNASKYLSDQSALIGTQG